MTKQQEFRKQTEEAKFQAFSLMCKKVADLEKENAELKEQNEKMKSCKICAYGGNDFGVCYSNKPCKNKNQWKLAKWINGR